MQSNAPTVRAPVTLGCTAAAAAVGLVVAVIIFGIVFLESGANSGRIVLNDPRAYALGSLEFVASGQFYLVRLQDGSFLALSNLDAANRASSHPRCRVAPLSSADPALPGLLATYASRMSAGAAGSTLLFRENCNFAAYDITGLRLDADGPNLDRHPLATNSRGKLTVDVTKRTCTRRQANEPFAPVPCP